jgi:nitrogen fixation/metabolism regulation signal transduction histidine kinase
MGSKTLGAGPYAGGLAVRAATIGGLCFAALEPAILRQYYAVSAVLVLLALLITADLWRAARRADRGLQSFIDALVVDEGDGLGSASGFPRLRCAVDHALDRLRNQRAALGRRIDYLQALCDGAPAALIAIQPDGSADFANRAARRLAGRSLARLLDADKIDPALAERLQALPAGGREIVTLLDGRQALVSVSEFRLPGQPAHRLISLQDLSALDPVELKAWQDLSRVLAHEIMNSLTPIASLAESLGARADQPAEVASALEVISRRSLGLMAFVDRYRQVAEVPDAVLEPVALAPLVAAIDQLMTPGAVAIGASYTSLIEPAELRVHADRELLEQAIINLVRNAFDAVADVSNPVVKLACLQVDDRVEITVHDNGPGVAEENRAKVFVPFFTTKSEGSGVGLSIARQIAAVHHGVLEIGSSEWSGAAFRLTLPLASH